MLLGDYPADTDFVRFGCTKCTRRGQYALATLLRKYGPDKKLPELIAEISADCPKRSAGSVSIMDLCGAHLLNPPG
jgi:hypothetical protein